MIDPTKDSLILPVSVKETLDELEISKDDYYRDFSISKVENLELHLIRKPSFYFFFNNYFNCGLKAWKANKDIKPVLISIRQ